LTAARAVAFGDLGPPAWGVAWFPGPGSEAPLAARVGSGGGVVGSELVGSDPAEPWRLEGEGVSLLFTPLGSDGHGASPDGGIEVVDQLCTVTGHVRLGGAEHEINCLGWHAALRGDLDLGRIESFRQVSAWFAPSRGLSLVALRPSKARGQDSDIVAATALEPDAAPPVTDPRLSTTYTARGIPERAGLELWPEDEISEDPAEAAPQAYPRRATGEAVGAGIGWETAGFALHAELLRWHSRGEDGAGVYLLGQRR
jgi:hypothetical protein